MEEYSADQGNLCPFLEIMEKGDHRKPLEKALVHDRKTVPVR
jgi:hypothetical protein